MNIKYIKPLFYSEDKVPAFIRALTPKSSASFVDYYNKHLFEICERLQYDIDRYKKTNDGLISREQHEINVCTLWWLKTNGGTQHVKSR